jgi:hypothetical protein
VAKVEHHIADALARGATIERGRSRHGLDDHLGITYLAFEGLG